LTAEEHRELSNAGSSNIQINLKAGTTWMAATGKNLSPTPEHETRCSTSGLTP